MAPKISTTDHATKRAKSYSPDDEHQPGQIYDSIRGWYNPVGTSNVQNSVSHSSTTMPIRGCAAATSTSRASHTITPSRQGSGHDHFPPPARQHTGSSLGSATLDQGRQSSHPATSPPTTQVSKKPRVEHSTDHHTTAAKTPAARMSVKDLLVPKARQSASIGNLLASPRSTPAARPATSAATGLVPKKPPTKKQNINRLLNTPSPPVAQPAASAATASVTSKPSTEKQNASRLLNSRSPSPPSSIPPRRRPRKTIRTPSPANNSLSNRPPAPQPPTRPSGNFATQATGTGALIISTYGRQDHTPESQIGHHKRPRSTAPVSDPAPPRIEYEHTAFARPNPAYAEWVARNTQASSSASAPSISQESQRTASHRSLPVSTFSPTHNTLSTAPHQSNLPSAPALAPNPQPDATHGATPIFNVNPQTFKPPKFDCMGHFWCCQSRNINNKILTPSAGTHRCRRRHNNKVCDHKRCINCIDFDLNHPQNPWPAE
jgi:hypothetical protein